MHVAVARVGKPSALFKK